MIAAYLKSIFGLFRAVEQPTIVRAPARSDKPVRIHADASIGAFVMLEWPHETNTEFTPAMTVFTSAEEGSFRHGKTYRALAVVLADGLARPATAEEVKTAWKVNCEFRKVEAELLDWMEQQREWNYKYTWRSMRLRRYPKGVGVSVDVGAVPYVPLKGGTRIHYRWEELPPRLAAEVRQILKKQPYPMWYGILVVAQY
jgi:hypothetical protein